ncbi:MAG: ABC transporter substrate-binding protein [Anaerolineales bacterium]|nr:ABC transporter substrate-binding protein [Anaerolineales bacterium]
MHKTKYLSILFLIALLSTACQPAAPAEKAVLKIAVLPIIDTLPLYVAQQEALFEKNNLEVVLVPVASAPERVQLVASAQVDGAINEILSVMLFNKDEIQMQAVRYALRPSPGYGHFFIIASGQSGITTPTDLANVEIGVSQGTVIEYVTERLLQAQGLEQDQIATIAVPKIPDRMALLGSGELQAGTLPDPLGALAVQSGGKIILDDSQHPQYGFSVYSFRADVIESQPEAVRSFLSSIEEAVDLINADPSKYSDILSDNKIVPPPLMETYQAPPFPAAGIPTEAEWQDAMSWAIEKGMLPAEVAYKDSVTPDFLP